MEAGNYGSAIAGSVAYLANEVNVGVAFAAQIVVEPVNSIYKAGSGFYERDYDKALLGSAETLVNFVGLRLVMPAAGVSRPVANTQDWAKLSGQLRDAAKGKGNFGIGSGTRAEAQAMGEAWVGPGYRTASDGNILLSKDGLRQYRPPSAKPSSPHAQTGVQANFESRLKPEGQWQGNAHLNIVD